MNRLAIIAALLSLTGCASMSTEMRAEEATWQVLNAADVATNDHRTTKTYVTGAALSIGHFAVSRWLSDSAAPQWVQRTWQFTTVGLTGVSIGLNFGRRSDSQSSPALTQEAPQKNTQPITCTTTSCL